MADGGFPGKGWTRETVIGVLEQEAAVRLNRRAQHLVVGSQRRSHRVRVGLPPTGRTLDIGEQKRHNP